MSLSFAATAVSADEFRQRRADAVRSGNPAWLWPEVSVGSWAVAMANITKATSAVLAGAHAELSAGDPMALCLACYTSGMGPLMGWWAEQKLLTAEDEMLQLLALHLQQARARAEKTERQAREIVTKLAKADVPVVVLKGGHTAATYFPEAATRPASDLDLLVPREFADEAEATLGEAGLKCTVRNARESSWSSSRDEPAPQHLWLVGADDPWSVDVHRSLDFDAGPAALNVQFDAADPFATCEPWPLDGFAGTLNQPLLLLHLAVHASGGLHSLTLLRMVEIIFVVRRDQASLFWEEFITLGAQIGALGAAYPALCMSEKLAPGTFPASVLAISRELAPARVRAVVESLEPANVQRIDRASIAEHFMWVRGASGWTRQLWADLTAGGASATPIYLSRVYRLLRGRITR